MASSFSRSLCDSTCVFTTAVLAAIVLSSGWTNVSADEPTAATAEADARFDLIVREDIFAGFNGDDKAMQRGVAKCDEVLAKNPKHAEAMVWRGSAKVFQAGQAFSKGNAGVGMQLWTAGLKDVDKAVELEPENIAVRIPRAAVLMPASANVPAFMAKPLVEKAKADFEKI